MNKIVVVHEQQVLNKTFTIYGDKENPKFLAKDVANLIGHTDPSKMVRSVDEDEKVKNIVPTPGGPQEMQLLTEDGLYEVLMQSRKPIARQFKKEVKHILKNIRKHGGHLTNKTIEQALLDPDVLIQLANNIKSEQQKRYAAEQAVIDANQIIEAQKPKVLFADSVSASEDTITIGQLAKLISQNGVKIGRTRMFQWLRENKYLIDSRGDDYNVPTQYTMERGWFEVEESTFRDVYGNFQLSFKVRVTGKGQNYFINKFIKAKGVMAI